MIASDYLGSGYSDHRDPDVFTYTFDMLADHVTGFLDALKLGKHTSYMQDFGAPVGFRVSMRTPTPSGRSSCRTPTPT